jgi:hypothetical protein
MSGDEGSGTGGGYGGADSGGYGTGGAAIDEGDLLGGREPKLEEVFPEEEEADARLRREVKERLAQGGAGAGEIDVSVQAGVVRLSGAAESWEARRQAEDAAAGVEGVRHVVTDIRVRPS